LAKRSTCARLQVGTVITTPDLTQVLGIGYNGNARGLPNRCDSTTPGACGCIHSEMNAVIKAGAQLPGKVMFVSASPCVMCAKMAINANVARVYYREAYRDPAGLDTLRQGGVEVIPSDQRAGRASAAASMRFAKSPISPWSNSPPPRDVSQAARFSPDVLLPGFTVLTSLPALPSRSISRLQVCIGGLPAFQSITRRK